MAFFAKFAQPQKSSLHISSKPGGTQVQVVLYQPRGLQPFGTYLFVKVLGLQIAKFVQPQKFFCTFTTPRGT